MVFKGNIWIFIIHLDTLIKDYDRRQTPTNHHGERRRAHRHGIQGSCLYESTVTLIETGVTVIKVGFSGSLLKVLKVHHHHQTVPLTGYGYIDKSETHVLSCLTQQY